MFGFKSIVDFFVSIVAMLVYGFNVLSYRTLVVLPRSKGDLLSAVDLLAFGFQSIVDFFVSLVAKLL